MGLEGIIAKHRQSVYRPRMRSREWIKIPVRQRDEFVIGGYLTPSPEHLSTLIVGQYDRAGKSQVRWPRGDKALRGDATGHSAGTPGHRAQDKPLCASPHATRSLRRTANQSPSPVGTALDDRRGGVQGAHERRTAPCCAEGRALRQESKRSSGAIGG